MAVQSEDRKRVAQLRLRARRRRTGQLRRRSIVLSLDIFALLWAAVFVQMVSGHDPVLGTGTKVAAVTQQDPQRAKKRPSATRSDSSELAIDPVTGEIVRVPSASSESSDSSSSEAAPAPAAPAPVVTSQS